MIRKFTLSIVLLSIAGCAGTSPSFDSQKLVLNPDVRAKVMAVQDRDEIKRNVKNGILQMDAGNYESALKYFQAGIRLNPRHGHLHFLNALTYHFQSLSGDSTRLELAETGYRLALKFDPGNYWAAYMLGQIYFSQQRYLNAQNQFAYGLLFAPKNQTLLRALSVASYYTKNAELGQWAANKAYTLSPENPSTLLTLLFNRAAIGDIDGASKALNEYQHFIQGEKSQSHTQEWKMLSVNHLAERVADWGDYHQYRNKYAQAGVSEIFGTGAQAEGTLLDIDSAPGVKVLPDNGSSPTDTKGANDKQQSNGGAAKGEPTKKALNLPRMALIDVVILSIEESRSQTKGVNLLAGLEATLSGTLYARERTLGSDSGADASRDTATYFSPTLTFTGLKYNLNIFNDGVNKAEVLARPTLLAVENQTSKFYSGAILHVEIRGTLADDGSLEQLPIGIHMEVTPHFHDDETIEIVVHAQRDNIEDKFEETSVRTVAQVTTTSVDSTAILKFGETLILSGLSEHGNTHSKDGVPLLQNIPMVQYLFSREEDQQTKKSVIVLLTPHKPAVVNGDVAIRDPDLLTKQEQQKQIYTSELKQKFGIKVTKNIDAAFALLSGSELARNFRNGDLKLDDWHDGDTLSGALRRILGFLYY